MRSLFLPIVLAVGFACVSGCGGSGGGGGGGGSHTNNSYAAAYAGEFEDVNGVIAPFTMTVLLNGTLSGQLEYPTGTKTFTGTVKNDGIGSIMTSTGTSGLTLTLSMESSLGGTIANTNGNGAYFAAVTNPTNVFGGPNPFTGDFAGTVHNSTINATGVVAMAVDSSGNLTGTDLVNVNGVPTLSPINGTITGSGTINYLIIATNVTVTGTVTLSGGTLGGSLTGSNGDSLTLSCTGV
jgi:hypothetical protein